jgi:hypothetical protein
MAEINSVIRDPESTGVTSFEPHKVFRFWTLDTPNSKRHDSKKTA